MNVTVAVDGIELDDEQQAIVDLYESNIETFLRKNRDYGSSFSNTAKVESILKHGDVVEDELDDIVATQLFVRMMDKMSRFYQLQFEHDDAEVGDESVQDSLLDLSNYAIMLAAELQSETTCDVTYWNQNGFKVVGNTVGER